MRVLITYHNRRYSALTCVLTLCTNAMAFIPHGQIIGHMRTLGPLSLVDDGDDLLFGLDDEPPPSGKGDGSGDTTGGSSSAGGGDSSRRRRSGGGGGEGEDGGMDGPVGRGGDSSSSDDGPSFTVANVLKSRGVVGLEVPNGIGVGTLAWGEKRRGFNSEYNIADLQGAYNTLVEGGISFFDTSELYGYPLAKEGMSAEQMLGKFSNENFRYDCKVATKYSPGLFANAKTGGGAFKPRFGRRAVVSALEQSLERLERGYVDVYQLEAPSLPYAGGNKALYEGIARAKERGLCNAVGVCNFNAKQLKQAHSALEALGVPLVSNQVEFSLLNQKALEDRTIDTCKQLGVVVLGHTPLAGGLGSGKYTATNPTGGKFVNSRGAGSRRPPSSRPGGGRYGPAPGAKYSFDELRRWLPIHNALTSVARSVSIREEMKVSPTQIALNWVVAKGVVPLPGVNTNADANEVVGCIGWRLRAQDIETLDKAVEESRNTKVERQTLGYTQY